MESEHRLGLTKQPVAVVGIGASAGGLEALQQFLTFLPSNTGMAFVIIQHLAPNHKSLLTDILGKYSAMPVTEILEGTEVERNHIYMIPPKYNVRIEDGILKLAEHNPEKISHPIDVFFRSLANEYENRSIAIIMSGTGSDGTNGIRSIKEANGLIIVQTPESAKFDGMPRNAIATGFADLVQTPDAIAREMSHIGKSLVDVDARFKLTDEDLLTQIFSILRNVTNINYAYYKQTTILRRIERRLVVTHNRNLQEYVNFLGSNPEEAKFLAKEVLIGVTSFFRDPEYFDVLKETVIKQQIKNMAESEMIRVWVAGCSSGEEAYSIAILFTEAMEELGVRRDVKIFATDLDADSISTAVRGIYGDNIIEDVSVARLSRYFTRKGNKYVIRHDIRKMIIFAQHNVFQDPPFGKLDLICCRNVLIYFQTVLQRNLFAIFHVALNDGGYLFLGQSESVMDYDDVFRAFSANEKIFVHNRSGKAPEHERFSYAMHTMDNAVDPAYDIDISDEKDAKYKYNELDTSVLEGMMPPCVLVDDKNELVRSYGDCSKVLSVPPGKATLDIFMLIRNDLKIALSTVLKDARANRERAGYDRVPVEIDGSLRYMSLVALPIRDHGGDGTAFVAVAFLNDTVDIPEDLTEYKVDVAANMRIADLEHELKRTKDELKQTVTELESVNAELQAANEELLTANEELQSSNEELQSVNEELYTVNSEYQSKVTELASVNDDMANFLSTTLVGMLMVDRELNIRKYTEYVASEFNIVEQDVGRSLRYIAYNFATIDLMECCRNVIDTHEVIEEHCASISGKTYLVRIVPYHAQSGFAGNDDGKGRLQGVVISFADTTKQIDDQEQIEEMAQALREAVRSGKEKETFLSQMSHDMRTPMTAIYGLTELILKRDDLPDEVRADMNKVLVSSEYMVSLIEEILETSRLNAGRVVSVLEPVREAPIIESIGTIIREQADNFGLNFEMDVRGMENKYVMMDAKHVERVIMNLLNNSLQFTPAGGKIFLEVRVSYVDARAEYTYVVRDNGIGISDDFQQRMFMPFEQFRDSMESMSGTGLGLYICKNLIDLMGGRISWWSKIGEGTEFTVHLSYAIASEEQIAMAKQQRQAFEDAALYGKNVLVAEDNSINAEVIVELLRTKGIRSEVAKDGREAVEIYRDRGAYHFQAILMDIMMPIKNGVEAATEIRELSLEDAEDIPIIALTADVTEETKERCRNAGMDMVISKPINQEKLFFCLYEQME